MHDESGDKLRISADFLARIMLFITLSMRIYQTVKPHTKLKKRGGFKKKVEHFAEQMGEMRKKLYICRG